MSAKERARELVTEYAGVSWQSPLAALTKIAEKYLYEADKLATALLKCQDSLNAALSENSHLKEINGKLVEALECGSDYLTLYGAGMSKDMSVGAAGKVLAKVSDALTLAKETE